MPIYEYCCRDCGHRLEAIQRLADEPLTDCPMCDQPSLKSKSARHLFVCPGAVGMRPISRPVIKRISQEIAAAPLVATPPAKIQVSLDRAIPRRSPPKNPPHLPKVRAPRRLEREN